MNKFVKTGIARTPEKAEISVAPADYLFREGRIENTLIAPNGELVALKRRAHIDVTIEADLADTVQGSPPA